MKLNSLLNSAGITRNCPDTEITSVTDNTENVKNGSLFVAVEGMKHDGHLMIGTALEKGAAAVVTQKRTGVSGEILVNDSRAAYSFLSAAFCGNPQKKLQIIGITGTSGKTSTAQYLSYILNKNGIRSGVIGTLGISHDGTDAESGHTTPDCSVLFPALREMADAGNTCCVMEVSSQALEQRRTAPIRFDTALLTNIGRDHLDYHGRMENYIRAKSLLFRCADKVLINSDDAYAEQIAEYAELNKYYTYCSKCGCADFMAKNVRSGRDSSEFMFINCARAAQISIDSPCGFSVYNAVAAGAAAVMAGVDFYDAAAAMCTLPQIKGRAQRIEGHGFDVYIDFAHTPDSLGAVLRSLRKNCRGKIITVFGCGGDRDKGKRPEMGASAENYSDVVIITDDNPRTEEPSSITSDILSGIKRKKDVFVQHDREKAIALALNKAAPGDVVLIAGKGHEEYMIKDTGRTYFSDEKTVNKLLGII